LTKIKATTSELTFPYPKKQGQNEEINATQSHNVMVVEHTVKPSIQQDM